MTSSEIKNKIFTVSLNTNTPHKAYAAYNGAKLVITDILPLTGNVSVWASQLLDEIDGKVASDYIVLVEEKTSFFARSGTRFDFEDISPDGKINLFTAFEYFFALQYSGNVILSKNSQQFVIHESIVERLSDEKGRSKFSVNWEQFNGGRRALLLCVMAAMWEPMSDRYLRRYCESLDLDARIRAAAAGSENLGGLNAIMKTFGVEGK